MRGLHAPRRRPASDAGEKQRKGKKGVADARARDGRGGGKLQRGGAGRFHAGWTAWQGPGGLDLFGQKKRGRKRPFALRKKTTEKKKEKKGKGVFQKSLATLLVTQNWLHNFGMQREFFQNANSPFSQ